MSNIPFNFVFKICYIMYLNIWDDILYTHILNLMIIVIIMLYMQYICTYLYNSTVFFSKPAIVNGLNPTNRQTHIMNSYSFEQNQSLIDWNFWNCWFSEFSCKFFVIRLWSQNILGNGWHVGLSFCGIEKLDFFSAVACLFVHALN